MITKDVATLILRKLDIFTFCNCLKTAKYFETVTNERNLWEFFYKRDFIHREEFWRGSYKETYKFRFLFQRLRCLEGFYTDIQLFTKKELYFPFSKDGSETPLTKIPIEINLLENLKTISFDNHKLTEIPKGLFDLKCLTKLMIRGNLITKIPKDISRLTNLKLLNLGDNQIKSIPPEIGVLTKLEALILSNNKIKRLPKEVANLKALYSIILDGCKITSIDEEVYDLINFNICIK